MAAATTRKRTGATKSAAGPRKQGNRQTRKPAATAGSTAGNKMLMDMTRGEVQARQKPKDWTMHFALQEDDRKGQAGKLMWAGRPRRGLVTHNIYIEQEIGRDLPSAADKAWRKLQGFLGLLGNPQQAHVTFPILDQQAAAAS